MVRAFASGLLVLVTSFSFGSLSAAYGATVSASAIHIGDVCDDFDADGGDTNADFNDCDEIIHNGGPIGQFSLDLLGLKRDPLSDGTFTISARKADLFQVGGGNNPLERFGFGLDYLNFGTLFDGSTADETAINPSLGAAVDQSIADSVGSDTAIDLTFTLAQNILAGIVGDGQISALFNFQGDVNSIRDLSVSVTYAAVPLPLGGALMLGGLAVFGASRRCKRNARTNTVLL